MSAEKEEKKDELEALFATFDKQFAACEQKFSEIEEDLKTFRAQQDEQEDTPPEHPE
jgi:hypothetical protein